MITEKKRKQGFKSRYDPKVYDTIAGTIAGLGYTDVQMSKMLNISRSTLQLWRKDNPTFNQAITDGKTDADEVVVQSLYQRACGYNHEDVHITAFKGEITLTPYTKYYPPDPTSMIFWLKNRDKDNWREKQVLVHEVADSDYIKDTPAEAAAKMDNLTAPSADVSPPAEIEEIKIEDKEKEVIIVEVEESEDKNIRVLTVKTVDKEEKDKV